MDIVSRVQESFDRQTFLKSMGARLDTVEKGKVSIYLEKNENLTQQTGFLHAGVTTSIADSAAGYAALTMLPEGCEVLSIEFKVNLLRPAASDRFLATGRVIKAGKQVSVVEADVVDLDSGKQVLQFQGTMIAVNP